MLMVPGWVVVSLAVSTLGPLEKGLSAYRNPPMIDTLMPDDLRFPDDHPESRASERIISLTLIALSAACSVPTPRPPASQPTR